MALRLTLGLLLTLAAFVVAGRRGWTLFRLIRSGQPAVGRADNPAAMVSAEVTEVLGQRKLLAWTIPGLAHFFAFWGFLVLGLTILETYGALFKDDFAFPLIGHWAIIGLAEDLFAVLVVLALITFTIIRFRSNPHTVGRKSRFFGSHTGAAWLVLFMIFNVVWTLLLYRGAQINVTAKSAVRAFPYDATWAFASNVVAHIFGGLSLGANQGIVTVGLLLQLLVVLGFLVLVLYSKHLHIFMAPINVATSRRPNALGPLMPMFSGTTKIDFEDPADDAIFGRGRITDFTWKGMLDMATCTECGRCQSQCPAWNTDKPLSPKLVVMGLRDHLFATAPYILATSGKTFEPGEYDDELLEKLGDEMKAEVTRPLVGTGLGVIDPDVLWACTTCGACVEQCPVDIEHIDHIVDMRRNQVMIESSFPTELNGLFKNVEQNGNPWGLSAAKRTSWIEEMDFEVRVFGANGEDAIPDDVDYLFWVGCAGAYDDRAKKTTKNVAELLRLAGVEFMVLGDGETCTGDPARRAGNEFLFQMQAMANVEVLNEVKAKKIVVTCPHCLNTLGREYPQVGGNYDVIHHSQLLAQLVRDGKLTPVKPLEEKITYHDPCYLGRHNKVYTPPRELVAGIPGVNLVEMPRNSEKSFCCGAGGARMWMEERIGQRINETRGNEAVATGATTIAVACPFCSVMLNDAVTQLQASSGGAAVTVSDISTLLLDSVRG
ncbi:MAG: (Fe-S)-binding protein [Actinomycetes bacterium]